MRIGLSVMMLLAAALQAGENLLPNGSFDEGGKEALHWEKTDNLTSFWRNDGQRGRILELDTRPDRKQVLAQALLAMPDKKNEVSGLMIMGLFGGTIFPLIMGFASDAMGQAGAVAVMAVGVAYLFTYIRKL